MIFSNVINLRKKHTFLRTKRGTKAYITKAFIPLFAYYNNFITASIIIATIIATAPEPTARRIF